MSDKIEPLEAHTQYGERVRAASVPEGFCLTLFGVDAHMREAMLLDRDTFAALIRWGARALAQTHPSLDLTRPKSDV